MPPPWKVVIGVEDTPYFHWQLPILLESLHGQLDAIVVLCSEWGVPSPAMRRIEEAYGIRLVLGANPGRCLDVDVSAPGSRYPALNRVEALHAAAPLLADGDIVFLAESDIFLFGDLDPTVMPRRNALQANELLAQRPFLQGHEMDGRGVDLQQLLVALGVERTFRPAGVTVFLDAATVRNETFRRDCFRFAQLVFLAGQIVQAEKSWHSEMACFALALLANGIDYEVIDRPEFTTELPEQVPTGTFYHYYHDPRDGGGFGAFRGEQWHKQAYRFEDFLATTPSAELQRLADGAVSEHARAFFQLAGQAKARVHPESA